MIKNIIFDLAGVLLNLDIERDTEALAHIGLPDFVSCLSDPRIAVPMTAYLNGLKGKDDFCRDLRPCCRQGVTDGEMLWAMDAVLADIPSPRIELLISLRKKYKVFLLSNIYDSAWEHSLKEITGKGFHVSQCFDRLFLSHEMGLAKPDPKIFQAVIEDTGINPCETLYLDDTRANVETGCTLGFQSILVPINGLEQILSELPL